MLYYNKYVDNMYIIYINIFKLSCIFMYTAPRDCIYQSVGSLNILIAVLKL